MIDKEIILAHCITLLEQRILNARVAMQEAQEATTSEEKSSAGDKYETGRAMGHLNSEMNAKQLQKASDELRLIKRIDLSYTPVIKQGSLIKTETNCYFIGVGLGPITIDGVEVITLSNQSPLAKLLMGKTIGSTFTVNNQIHTIKQIF